MIINEFNELNSNLIYNKIYRLKHNIYLYNILTKYNNMKSKTSNTKTKRRSRRSQRGGALPLKKMGEIAGYAMKFVSLATSAESLVQEVIKANNFYTYCQTINVDKINEPLKGQFSKMMIKLGKNITNLRANAIAPKIMSAAMHIRSNDRAQYDNDIAELMNISIQGKDDVPNPLPPPPEGFFEKAKSWGSTVLGWGNSAGIVAMCDWYRSELNYDLTNLNSIVTMIIGTSVLNTTRGTPAPLVTEASVIVPPVRGESASKMTSTSRKGKGKQQTLKMSKLPVGFSDPRNPYNALSFMSPSAA